MVDGWLVTVEPCKTLTQEQTDFIRWKLSILAVSTRGLFDNPVQISGQSMQAYYYRDYHATETAEHIRTYLQSIGRDGQITVTLQTTRWNRSQRDLLP